MRRLFFTFLFLPALLCASGFEKPPIKLHDRVDDWEEHSNDNVRLSGEILFLAPTVGLFPQTGSYSPGYRFSVLTDPFAAGVECGVTFSHWGAEKITAYQIPVFNKRRQITSSDSLSTLQVTLGPQFRLFKPYLGIEGEQHVTTLSFDEKWKVRNERFAIGPLMGVKLKRPLFRYFSLTSDLAFSLKHAKYTRQLDTTKAPSLHPTFFPKAKLSLGTESNIPLNGKSFLELQFCYEMQCYWSQDLEKELQWSKPYNLQGFTGQIRLNF